MSSSRVSGTMARLVRLTKQISRTHYVNYSSMPRPAISQNPVRSCNIKQTIIASSRKFQYFRGFFEKKEELTPEDELLIKIKRSILAIQEGEVQKAERHLSDAWKMSTELEREDVKTQIMDIQANLALQIGELDKALRLFQLVTQRMVYHQNVEVTDNSVVEISIKLAQIFAMKGNKEESLTGFQYCVDTQREKIKQGVKDEDTLMLAAWALQSLAQAYMTEGTQENKIDRANIAIAAEYEHEALAYVSEAVGQDSHQAVVIASDLASILALQGNVDGALKQLEECEKIAAEKYQYLRAAIRVNTGSLYLQKGEYSEANRVCKEARMIAGMYKDLESVMRADECISKSRDEMSSDTYQQQQQQNRTSTS
ncbi:tetratricopeptide repeat protein 19, mitochondrial isoform X2 [Folsomia candida]|uniref:tetratricopeptide repeat protein 19, mitochondrial isoform X2 n=1 Tax=Folsomia candida TaxID=158441 RepID=UPI001604BFD9|nr:tetratricopeptide repeat protein 19, mitochondrial isoform X2 [Folsomia candida]